ncbi:hypothetical protein Plhal304r1_c039g0117091 [Plasmopara halstedii]
MDDVGNYKRSLRLAIWIIILRSSGIGSVRIRENVDRRQPAQRGNFAQSKDNSGDFLFLVGEKSSDIKSCRVWLVD